MKRFLKSYIQKLINKRYRVFLFSSIVVLGMVGIMSISLGAANLSAVDVWKSILFGEGTQTTVHIIQYVRLPRTLATIICGASLAVAGVLLQSALHNVLASPATIGVNSGAGLFVVLSTLLFPGVFIAKPIFAFIGALLVAMLVFAIAGKMTVSRTQIIMVGMAITSLLSAMIDAIVTIHPESVMDKSAFYIGGFSNLSITPVLYILPIVSSSLIVAILLAPQMDMLLLGDEIADSLGMEVYKIRFLLLLVASVLAASAICLSGLLGFVGLVVPHIMRYLIGNQHHKLVPLTAIYGAILVTVCDVLARTLFTPYEIPVGIILSFLGAPFFLHLVLRKKGRVLS